MKTDKGDRDCEWDPSGHDDQGLGEGPGILNCDDPGPKNGACEFIPSDQATHCGATYNDRIAPMAKCSWQDQN